MRKKIIWLSAVGLIFFLVAMLWCEKEQTFSSERWKNEPEKREQMVRSLLNEYNLVGMSEDDVKALLGEEDRQQSSFKGDQNYYSPESTLVYFIGNDLLDWRWLVVVFEDGLVEKTFIGVT